MNKNILLQIVKTWNINPTPEYRGFRCGYCQKYIHKAWFNYLLSKEFTCPVHFCNKCQKKFESGMFGNNANKTNNVTIQPWNNVSLETVISIINKWGNETPKYKQFFCDLCHKDLIKAYHVWGRMDNTLIELHFCKKCWEKKWLVEDFS